MAKSVKATQNREEAVQPRGMGLPEHLARLVNPAVVEKRRSKIERELGDVASLEERRQRYIHTITDHVWKELKSA